MEKAFWISIGLINFLSILVGILVHLNANRFLQSQIRVLGSESGSSLKTPTLRIYQFIYLFLVLQVALFSILFFKLHAAVPFNV